MVAALPQPVHVSGLGIGEDARAGYDLRLLGMRQRHLDDDDGEQRRVGILIRVSTRAARQLFCGTHARGPGDVDIDVVLVFGVDYERMRVRAAAGLHLRDLFRLRDIGDIEDADALDPIRARRWRRWPPWAARSVCGRICGRRRGGGCACGCWKSLCATVEPSVG